MSLIIEVSENIFRPQNYKTKHPICIPFPKPKDPFVQNRLYLYWLYPKTKNACISYFRADRFPLVPVGRVSHGAKSCDPKSGAQRQSDTLVQRNTRLPTTFGSKSLIPSHTWLTHGSYMAQWARLIPEVLLVHHIFFPLDFPLSFVTFFRLSSKEGPFCSLSGMMFLSKSQALQLSIALVSFAYDKVSGPVWILSSRRAIPKFRHSIKAN